jgi:trans-2-enoyl-CoA reductase
MNWETDAMENATRQEIDRLMDKLTKEQLEQLKDYLHNVIYIE